MSALRRTSHGRRRAGTLLVALTCLAVAVLPASAQPAGPRDRLEDIQERTERVRRRLERVEARGTDLAETIGVLDDRRARVERKVDALDVRLAELDGRIAEVEQRLTLAQHELTALSEELQAIRARLTLRTGAFEKRAVAAYKAGPTAYIDGLLGSDSFSDLMDRYAYFESVLDADSELIDEIATLEAETEIQRNLVEEKKNEIARAQLRLESDRAAVAAIRGERAFALAAKEAVVAQKKDVLAGVRAEERRLEQIEAQLQADSARITALLAQPAPAPSVSQEAPDEPLTSGTLPTGGAELLWPAAGPVTSGFGYRTHPIFGDTRFHSGIDIGAPYGAPVVASDTGVVVFSGAMSGYGNVVVVDHGGGLATTYNHLSSFVVGSGQRVRRGAQIAAVGCTGYCTGPHLHFEVRVNGSPVDPMPYLQ